MEESALYKLFARRSNWVLHLIYWLISAFLMFGLFSNSAYDLQVRISLVLVLIIVSFFTALVINKYLVHRFLFEGKAFLFIYLLIGVFIITFWVVSISVILIIAYSILKLPDLIIPTRLDTAILVTGNFLVVIVAVVIHFVKESYRRFLEKNQVEKQKQQTELKLKEANLKLLQGQIHPHFLFNMLNNLYGLVKEDVENSRDIIMRLSSLLDYMLYECDKPEVKLSDEIEFIKNYIELERIRHDENFNVKTRFKASDNIQIAPLILFPFVENAFKHGFHDPGKSSIHIELEATESLLNFTCENNMVKIKHDKYLKQEGKGIGLKNIKDRLELIYHNKYELEISELDEKFIIDLKINLD